MNVKKIGLCCVCGIVAFGASIGMNPKLPNDIFNGGNWPEQLQLQNTTYASNKQNARNKVVLPNDVFDCGTWPADLALLDAPRKTARQDVETMTETPTYYQPQEQQPGYYLSQEQQPGYYQPQEQQPGYYQQPVYYQPQEPRHLRFPTINLSISFQ